MNTEILLGVGMFTAIIMVLVTVILMARKQLVAAGAVDIEINGDPDKTSTAAGGKPRTLADAGIFLSSACGGGGTCGQCRCRVVEGGGSMLSTEAVHFTRGEAKGRVASLLPDSGQTRHENRGAR